LPRGLRFCRHPRYIRAKPEESAMIHDPMFLLVSVSTLVVLIILMFGIGSFARGGEFNRKHANRIMRYRIIAQAVAVIIIVGVAWLRSKSGS